MTQFISISHCPFDGADTETVHLGYTITAEDSIRTISCAVTPESRHGHRWLSMRKFDVRLVHEKGRYTMLHNERNDAWSRDTGRFIDAVWTAILKKEAWLCN